MTLIEIMFALFILAVAVLGIAATAASAVRQVRLSRDRDLATSATSAAIEAARGFDFDVLSLDDSNVFSGDPLVSGGTFAHDGTDAEPLVTTSTGLTPYACIQDDPGACWFDFAAYAHSIDRVATYVTWYDDDDTVDSDGDGTADNDRDGKRVTTVATWTDGDAQRTVRQSSLLAPAKRGLGTPEFVIRPETFGSTSSPRPVRSGEAFCLEHELENLGADDSYDFWIDHDPDPSTITNNTNHLHLKVNSKRWNVYAWLGGDPEDDPATYNGAWKEARTFEDEFNNSSTTPNVSDDLLLFRDGDADDALESAVSVAKDQTVEMAICYAPDKNTETPAPPDQFAFIPLIRSELAVVLNNLSGQPAVDQEGVVDLDHHVKVTDTASSVFLDDNDEEDLGGVTESPPFVFDRGSPPTRTLPDFTTDFDADVSGYGLLKPSNNGGVGQTLAWVDSDTDVSPVDFNTATVRMWTSWNDAIKFGSTQQKDMTFAVRLCAVNAVGSPCPATGEGVRQVTYTHNVAGWAGHTLSYTFTSAQQGTFLRLEFQCLSGSSDKGVDCHVAFDTQTFPSRLDVSKTS